MDDVTIRQEEIVWERHYPVFDADTFCHHSPLCGVWTVMTAMVARGKIWESKHYAVGFNTKEECERFIETLGGVSDGQG